jgi:ABC-type Mn2+/Zn2+ transport system permease subunit
VTAELWRLWELFPHSLAAGLLIAVVCSLLGVLVILKRVVFIGITLSEVAALGIALAMALHLPPLLGAAGLTLSVVVLLALPLEPARVPADALMGVVFVASSALAVLVVAGSGFGLHEVKTLLYGDLILTSPSDLALMAAVLLPVLAALLLFLRPILYTFLDREAAQVLGIRVLAWELVFFCCLGLAVSASSQAAGALLVFCYLVAPPSAGLLLSRRLGVVMLLSALTAALGTLGGLTLSLAADLPANQTVVAVVAALFACAALGRGAAQMLARRRP